MTEKTRKRRSKGKAGRPVEPGSLRQSGVVFRCRLPAELFERATKLAGHQGVSAVVRGLLEKWVNSQG